VTNPAKRLKISHPHGRQGRQCRARFNDEKIPHGLSDDFLKGVEKYLSPGCSKMFRCKARKTRKTRGTSRT
jgi:hypothetical protein